MPDNILYICVIRMFGNRNSKRHVERILFSSFTNVDKTRTFQILMIKFIILQQPAEGRRDIYRTN